MTYWIEVPSAIDGDIVDAVVQGAVLSVTRNGKELAQADYQLSCGHMRETAGCPACLERNEGRHQLQHGATRPRLLISRDKRQPVAGVGHYRRANVGHACSSAEAEWRRQKRRGSKNGFPPSSALVRNLAVMKCGLPHVAMSMRQRRQWNGLTRWRSMA